MALVALLSAFAEEPEEERWFSLPFSVSGGARAYFESAYLSSSGTLSYTKPVAEQVAWINADLGDYGYILADGWLCSALNGQTDDVHRRAFYCFEGTTRYGYNLKFTGDIALHTNGGLLWDWLGGYEAHHGTPLAVYAMQHLRNPILTPYWNLLHRFDDNRWRVHGRRDGFRRGMALHQELVSLVPLPPVLHGEPGRALAGAEARHDRPPHRLFDLRHRSRLPLLTRPHLTAQNGRVAVYCPSPVGRSPRDRRTCRKNAPQKELCAARENVVYSSHENLYDTNGSQFDEAHS